MQPLLSTALSVVVPVYGNAQSIPALIAALRDIAQQVDGGFEAVFVVDGSPDRSHALLRDALPAAGFRARLVQLTRNFGAFPAIRVGLEKAEGEVIAVMAADLQEPPELALAFLQQLRDGSADVVFGVRDSRRDPAIAQLLSKTFWSLYRRFVMPDIPKGGVDIFAVSRRFRDRLIALRESNTSLIAQLFWLGGVRVFVPYQRRRREHGRSAWTFAKRLNYLSDSVFAFSDLPVRILMATGALALATAAVLGIVIVIAKVSGLVAVPGYAGTILTILFFGAINTLGLGVVGSYAWRAFENTKDRPLALVHSDQRFDGPVTGERMS
ncbi:MAG: glycosyltransferase family 2 protein [Luteimonas sp.]